MDTGVACWPGILKEFYSQTSSCLVKQEETKKMERCSDFRENKKRDDFTGLM